MSTEQKLTYESAVNGRFSGILRWPEFEALWALLASGAKEWYVYAPDEGGVPQRPHSVDELRAFLNTTESYLRERCKKDFCGAVYADSLSEPRFIKIYNPHLMGGCGLGKAPLPQWLVSQIEPVSLID